MFDYNARILKVIDGDSVQVELDLGFSIKYKNTVRLGRINASELRDSDLAKQKSANEAKEWLKQKLPVDTKVLVISKALDKYGRILGEIILNNQNISDLLLEQKLVDPY